MKRPYQKWTAQIDEAGRLILPAELATRLGLKPGSQVQLGEENHTIHLQRPLTSLAKVYIEPTNICNMNCSTCMRNVWEMSLGRMSADTFELIISSLKDFDPLPTIFFGGIGEPLSHPELIEMVRQVKSLGARVELITNGTLLDEELSTRLIEVGLDMLWVSIDGATPESYADVRLGDALPQVIENLQRLQSLRQAFYSFSAHNNPDLGIAFVAMRRNITDLPAVLQLGTQLGATHFSISNLLPYTPELASEILYNEALYDQGASSFPALVPRASMPRFDLNTLTKAVLVEVLDRKYQVTLAGGEMNTNIGICPFIHKGSVSIRWDGEVSPCLALMHPHVYYLDDRQRRSYAYSVGNINQRRLVELWNDPEYIALRERLLYFDFSPCAFCNSCELANENMEDCFGNILPACGGCLWAQGLIQCP